MPGGLGFAVAAGQDRAAEAWLRKPQTAFVFQNARTTTLKALERAPYDNSALLRLAYLDKLENAGVLGQGGLQALETSYDRVPLDPYVAFWRIRFVLESWEQVPVELRLKVQQEVFALASEPGHRWPLRKLMRHIGNPYGAMAAAFWRVQLAKRIGPARLGI